MNPLSDLLVADGPDPAFGDKLQLHRQFLWVVGPGYHRAAARQAHFSTDDGVNWQLVEEMRARRR